MVLAIGDVDCPASVADQIVRNVELAFLPARLTPGQEKTPLRIELVNASVTIAVGNINLPFGRQRTMRASIERLVAHERRRLVRNADSQKELSFRSELAHGVIRGIGTVDRVVGADVYAMGSFEH